MDKSERDAFIQRIETMPITAPPEPWTLKEQWAVGGLLEIGFDENSELLLVITSTGRGVFDCRTGEKVARDRQSPDEDAPWYDEDHLLAEGIGPLSGKWIRLSGLNGGGLKNCCRTGWKISVEVVAWPMQNIILSSPWSLLYKPESVCWKIFSDYEVRACGFSYTGKSLIIATSSDLIIYGNNQ